MKKITFAILIIIFSVCLIYFLGNLNNHNKTLAASGDSASDLQLMARAINRRS